MPLDATELSRLLRDAGLVAEAADERFGALGRISVSDAGPALTMLKSAGFVMFVDEFGADTGESLEVTWHVRRMEPLADAYLRATVAYDAELPSVWEVFPAALYPEREIAEMFGVTLTGHPNPKRLLTTDELDVWPLRKSVPVRAQHEMARPGIVRTAPVEEDGADG